MPVPFQNLHTSHENFSRLFAGDRAGGEKDKLVISEVRFLSCWTNLDVHIHVVVKGGQRALLEYEHVKILKWHRCDIYYFEEELQVEEKE